MTVDIEIQRRERVQRLIDMLIHHDQNYRERFERQYDKFITKWEENYIESKDGLITCTPATERIITRL